MSSSAFQNSIKAINDYGKKHPLTGNEKLLLYGLYKQATNGDNKNKRPSRFKIIQCKKHDAWASHRGKTQKNAIQQYETVVKNIINKK